MTEEDQREFFLPESLKGLFNDRIVKSRAVGRDGMKLGRFRADLESEVELISKKVLAGSYRFTPYKERLISRGAQRTPRQISIPTIRDRLTLRATCNLLAELVPEAKPRVPHSYIKSIVERIRKASEHKSFIRVDVQNFYPSIDHKILLMALESYGCAPFLLALIEKAIATSTGPSKGLSSVKVGVPQGLSISNSLAAIYLLQTDREQSEYDDEYFRYVDDILVICPSHRATDRFKQIYGDLAKVNLTPHCIGTSGKSEIRLVSAGIDYLGYNITPARVSVRKSSYARMFINLSRVITKHRYRKDKEKLIFRLNLKITGCVIDGKRRGWLMFFAQTEDISQLAFLDKFVSDQLRRAGISPEKINLCRFVKAYYEIRYRGITSSYIPNFDTYSLDDKIRAISRLTGVSVEVVSLRPAETIELEFERLIAKEVADLEQDVIGAVS